MNLLAAEPEMASNGYIIPVIAVAALLQVIVLGIGVPLFLLGARGLIGIITLLLCLLLLLVSSTGVEG